MQLIFECVCCHRAFEEGERKHHCRKWGPPPHPPLSSRAQVREGGVRRVLDAAVCCAGAELEQTVAGVRWVL
jgi:hypothetical protein